MKKFIFLLTPLLLAFEVCAQSFPKLELMEFEGVSFSLAADEFIHQIKSELGWKILDSVDNGVIFLGEYCGTECLAAVEFTPKTKLPIMITLNIGTSAENNDVTYGVALIKLTRAYGEALDVEGHHDVKVWQPKYKGYETTDNYRGLIMLEKGERGVSLKMLDMFNRVLSDAEKDLKE